MQGKRPRQTLLAAPRMTVLGRLLLAKRLPIALMLLPMAMQLAVSSTRRQRIPPPTKGLKPHTDHTQAFRPVQLRLRRP